MSEPNAPFNPLHLFIILIAPGLVIPTIIYFRANNGDFNAFSFGLYVSVGLVSAFIIWLTISIAWQKFTNDRGKSA